MAKIKKLKTHQQNIKEHTKETSAEIIKEIAKSKGILSAIGDGISILDRTFTILYENKMHSDVMGDHVGEKCYKAYQLREGICGGCPVALTFKEGKAHTVQRELQTDKGIKYMEITASPLKDSTGKIVAGIEVVRDITERKSAQTALQETTQKLRNIIEHSNELYYVHDTNHVLSYVSQQSIQILGYTSDEMMFEWTRLVTDNPINEKGIEITEKALKTGERQPPYLLELYKKDRSKVLLEIDESPMKDEQGNVIGIVGAARDITERKRIEEALRESEEQHRTMIETMNEGLSVVDKKGIMSFVNDQFCKMLGYSREELLGSRQTLLLDEENQKILKKQWSNRIKGDATPYEITLTRKNGKKIHTLVAPRLIFDERGQFSGSFGIFTDITVLKQVQEELLSYQEQLRSLASELSLVEERQRRCIATELNDYIGQTLSYCKNKLVDLKKSGFSGNPKESTDEIIDVMNQTIEYTKSLTLQLGTPILHEEGLESALKWLGYQFQKQLGLVFHFEDDQKLKPLNDETTILLYQAVRELLINVSRHAKARNIHLSIKRDYKKVQIEVKDDGIGFNVSQIDPHSSRTGGFGLFAIHERLKYLGGHFKIESKPGNGTHAVLIAPLRSHK